MEGIVVVLMVFFVGLLVFVFNKVFLFGYFVCEDIKILMKFVVVGMVVNVVLLLVLFFIF